MKYKINNNVKSDPEILKDTEILFVNWKNILDIRVNGIEIPLITES